MWSDVTTDSRGPPSPSLPPAVSCIHWVEKRQLPALEHVMRYLVRRENVGVMMAGQGRPVEDVFAATARFLKQREQK